MQDLFRNVVHTELDHDFTINRVGFITINPDAFMGIEKKEKDGQNPSLTNCKNCGAPLHGCTCEYCGTEY